ncbi:hypothetical protein GCM10027535_18720 [Mycolicibacterium hippocampi]|uniref:Uncharacterized protein n=1 Tax=Mycolicibacterium hippocampi TaxID=659824 RepID=A0A7I9ZHM9_9MYCO|nr:hypothetical protein MHIP_09270 [Mycolicibacterium hippocampi]
MDNLWINGVVNHVYADERTIGRGENWGWEIGRRVVFGFGFGRVVFRAGTAQVNSRLGSL